ncbi:MAG: 4-hydroxybutyrate dehydrogenase [Anaeroplasmataceae bacterium]
MAFLIKPKIEEFKSVDEFINTYLINDDDLLFTNKTIYEAYFKNIKTNVFLYGDYGDGEPTDILVEKLYKDIKNINYKRVIAVGGGAIIDVGKLLALENISPVSDLFEGKTGVKRKCELLIIPTTCGTGSEVTAISILAITSKNTKLGLQNSELYPDKAILIPELLESLPYSVFATSSIDALVHAFESYTSPNATSYSKMFSLEAIKIILNAYKDIVLDKTKVNTHIRDLLIASNYAGIAFSNAGCALVHAMSYPLGAKYHVAHGESNYVFFTSVYKKYMSINKEGIIKELNIYLSKILECNIDECYEALASLLEHILHLKKMHEYGVSPSDIKEFVNIVITKQTRLTKNNYVSVTEKEIEEIYNSVY